MLIELGLLAGILFGAKKAISSQQQQQENDPDAAAEVEPVEAELAPEERAPRLALEAPVPG